MYIGRYGSNFTSYATKVGYTASHGRRQYCGVIDDKGTVDCGAPANDNAQARRNFCQRFGPVKCANGVRMCYGENCPTPSGGGGLSAQSVKKAQSGKPSSAPTPTSKPTSTPTLTSRSDSLKKIQTAIASGKGGGGRSGGGSGDCTQNPCPPPSAKGDMMGYWNQMSCQFGNMTCHALPDWGLSVIAGLGGILVIALLTKKRR